MSVSLFSARLRRIARYLPAFVSLMCIAASVSRRLLTIYICRQKSLTAFEVHTFYPHFFAASMGLNDQYVFVSAETKLVSICK